jgi:hypothetical protein
MLRRITYMQYKGIISCPRDLPKTALRQSKNRHSNHDSHPTRLSPFLYLQPLPLTIYLDPFSTKYASSIWFDCYLQSTMEISHHLDLHTFGRCSMHCHSVSLPKISICYVDIIVVVTAPWRPLFAFECIFLQE